MKNNKKLKPKNNRFNEDVELLKPKKKMGSESKKVNLKSPKFWQEVIMDDEIDELPNLLRE